MFTESSDLFFIQVYYPDNFSSASFIIALLIFISSIFSLLQDTLAVKVVVFSKFTSL